MHVRYAYHTSTTTSLAIDRLEAHGVSDTSRAGSAFVRTCTRDCVAACVQLSWLCPRPAASRPARAAPPAGGCAPRAPLETHRLSPVSCGPTRPVQSSASAAGCSCMTWSYSSRSTAVTPTRASPIPRARELQLDIHMFIGRNHMFNGPYSWNSCVHDTSTRSGLRYRRPPAN